ncbi:MULTISPECIES: Spy/CpxP family protein refolding chaperone [unclassified Coleofasciculus]|uniref:Spy/CpxP family protein refolding chaperone n=1 Tax=unclassified Coleofasciculus TaxID=2692782 RepID=UPI001882F84E|nr:MULTISPECIES: Spy/CpxP family protein refolding chaperone [unclassified Coleofasciculus]MBE9129141.1 Spy/CpxP family protein refolding chaperone [Coleofasciculus sp. LEGE 07081]MBE9149520.1 Spy/CpxP family protein refolding chaperone [Coleofasciculus sp. LEGE 07092]
MKIKVLPLLASIAAIALTTAPMAVRAQPPFMEELNLTAEQKAQLEQIRESTDSQIEQILSPEQQQQFQTIRTERQRVRGAREALNLSDEQRDQMREIHQSAREQMQNVLTEEQRQQMREAMQSRRGEGRFRGRNQPR